MSDHTAERRLRTLHGIPDPGPWEWWWRARHVTSSPEHRAFMAYCRDLEELYAEDIQRVRRAVAADRRRLLLRVVG
jgi:hypothetical protein